MSDMSLVLKFKFCQLYFLCSIIFLVIGKVPVHSHRLDCGLDHQTFEISTGRVFTAPDDTLELLPGTLHLTECLEQCRRNSTCRSANFETGLCVLFASSAADRPDALTPSEYPVFTIYAQRICLRERPCRREWSFERVRGRELMGRARKSFVNVSTEGECMSLCLGERGFECRSANYRAGSRQCQLSDRDRNGAAHDKAYAPAEPDVVYLENNCVDSSRDRLCEFRKVSGKLLKTVDAVFQEVETLDECRRRCLSVDYRCHAFDMGDPTNSVCRLSHLSAPALQDIQDPYLEIHGASTYEMASCYNVTIDCRSREMVAFVKTTEMFNGKVYAKSKPNSCVTDVINSMDFEIRMAYHDLNCDVKQQNSGEFANDIVIQHHDMIVTNQDLGVTVHCQYDLSNRSVVHGVKLDVNNVLDMYGSSHSVSVGSPNISMSVTDRLGQDIVSASVGDPLLLRFEITDPNSPYDIFVRELVAMDGIDNSEILLIDALGCPTDTLIMGAVSKARTETKALQAVFDAFKFPTSEFVQFKALVTPCLPVCQPANCTLRSFDAGLQRTSSFGRRRRRSPDTVEEDEVVVVKTIHISDKFGFDRESRRTHAKEDVHRTTGGGAPSLPACVNLAGVVAASSLFLVAQVVLLVAWAVVWRRREKRHKGGGAGVLRGERSIDMIYGSRRNSSFSNAYEIDNPCPQDLAPYDTVYNADSHMSPKRRF